MSRVCVTCCVPDDGGVVPGAPGGCVAACARAAASSSLSGTNGVGSSARSTTTYGALVDVRVMLPRSAQPLRTPRSVLASR